MEIITKYLILALFLFASLGCGSRIPSRIAPPETNVSGLKVTTVLKQTNDTELLISDQIIKPRIFIFASTFCGVCQKEHRELRDLMALNNNLLPNNVDIFTVMTGATDSTDSLDFKDFTGIQWEPFYQPGDELRNLLCGQGTANPCIVIETPNQGIIFKHFGEVSISELQTKTGVWTW